MPADPKETNERMVYEVPSDEVPGRKYRVDLIANRGAGQCACRDFNTRRQPAIDRGEPVWTKATSCKHSRRAAWFFIKKLFREMAQAECER